MRGGRWGVREVNEPRATRRTGVVCGLILLATSCRSSVPASDAPASVSTSDADSVVLERTMCFGTCPAYRLSVTRDGVVSFRSRNPGDTTAATARVSPDAFTRLAAEAEPAGLFALPAKILGDSVLCSRARTDAPTVTTTLFAAGRVVSVARYAGCARPDAESPAAPLLRLRDYENRIDSVAGSARWVRPASRR